MIKCDSIRVPRERFDDDAVQQINVIFRKLTDGTDNPIKDVHKIIARIESATDQETFEEHPNEWVVEALRDATEAYEIMTEKLLSERE